MELTHDALPTTPQPRVTTVFAVDPANNSENDSGDGSGANPPSPTPAATSSALASVSMIATISLSTSSVGRGCIIQFTDWTSCLH